MVVHGGQMKAPKVLADVVESIVAAVYFDCGSNFQRMWTIIKRILEPLVMLYVALAQPQPIPALFEACAKDGKHVDIKYERNGDEYIASVFVDDTFIASGSSLTKENAKLHAAEAALAKLTNFKSGDTSPQTNVDGFSEVADIEGAKQKVLELCDKKKWQKPTFRAQLPCSWNSGDNSAFQMHTSHSNPMDCQQEPNLQIGYNQFMMKF